MMAYIIGILGPEEKARLEALGWEFELAKKVAKEIYSPQTGQPCPECDRGKIEKTAADDMVCCTNCLKTWVNRDHMFGCYVDNDVYAIMTGPDWQTDDPWSNDLIQFARLLSEINANVTITSEEFEELCQSMDLSDERINELFDRAGRAWEKAKRVHAPPPKPRGLDEQIAQYIAHGLGDAEITRYLEGVERHDLVGVIRQLMSDDVLFCAYCGQKIGDPETARFSQYNEPVCGDCRDKEARCRPRSF